MFVSLNLLTKMAHVRVWTNKFTCFGLHVHELFLLKTFKDINNHIFSGVRFSISSFLVIKSQTYISREFSIQHPDKLRFTSAVLTAVSTMRTSNTFGPLLFFFNDVARSSTNNHDQDQNNNNICHILTSPVFQHA